MNVVFWLLMIQGALGAFDTLFYHEWRAHLPAGCPGTSTELQLHAARDFIYLILFATLPYHEWHGGYAVVLVFLLLTEIAITITDFVVEDRTRQNLGGVYPGERATHTIIAIIYGAMLANFCPILLSWCNQPSNIISSHVEAPIIVRYVLGAMAILVFFSGLRDILAAAGIKECAWPWSKM